MSEKCSYVNSVEKSESQIQFALKLTTMPPFLIYSMKGWHDKNMYIQGVAILLVEKPPLVYVPNMYKGWQGVVGEARGGNYTDPFEAVICYIYSAK